MQNQLARLIKNQMFEGFLLVKNAEQRTSSNGSKFLDMTLSDVSGEFNGKMWDGNTPPPPVGKVIRLRGLMQEYNNRPQLRDSRGCLSSSCQVPPRLSSLFTMSEISLKTAFMFRQMSRPRQ